MKQKYKPGQAVFFNWDSWIGEAIKYMTDGDYSHIGIISKVNYDEKTVIIHEALLKGLTRNTYSFEYLEQLENQGIAKVIMPKYPKGSRLSMLYDVCVAYEKESYAIIQYPYIIYWLIVRKLGGRNTLLRYLYLNKHKTESDKTKYINLKGVICSEFFARVVYTISDRKMNYEELIDKPFDLITPSDIFRHIGYDWK